MKITERALRGLIRKIIQEAPLADLAPSRVAQDRVGDSAYARNDIDLTSANKIFGSSGFKRKFEKLVGNWPQDVWVYPVTVARVRSGDRFIIASPQEMISKYKSYESYDVESSSSQIVEIVNEWLKKTRGKGTLIVPYASEVRSGNELTPWMLFHAMFDNTSYESYPFLEKAKIIKIMLEEIMWGLEEAAQETQLQNWAEMLERVFTMGSARKKYFSKIEVFDDIPNEAAAQSLTTGGFRYNKEAFEELRAAALQAGVHSSYIESIDAARPALEEAEALSPAARQEFLAGINGKVIVIDVT